MEKTGNMVKARSKGRARPEKDFVILQNLLVRRREEIFSQVADLEGRWQELSEPQVEVEEMAQGVELTEPYSRLDEIERKEVREIDLALSKITAGAYGICEACGQPITLKRLKAVPWTRYCRKDAESQEKPLWAVP